MCDSTGNNFLVAIGRLLYHSTLGLRVIKKKREVAREALYFLAAAHYVPTPTLKTTSGQMIPPKSGRVQECHLIQVSF